MVRCRQAVILLLLPIGAMAGSTAGGIKLIRVLAVASYAHREALRHLHPRLVRPVRVGGGIMPDRTANKIVGFLILALAIFGGGALAIAMTGPDLITSFSAAATAIGNVGPGLGDVGPTNDFLELPRFARWVTMVQMLLGRLEIYPVILALSVVTLRRRHRDLTGSDRGSGVGCERADGPTDAVGGLGRPDAGTGAQSIGRDAEVGLGERPASRHDPLDPAGDGRAAEQARREPAELVVRAEPIDEQLRIPLEMCRRRRYGSPRRGPRRRPRPVSSAASMPVRDSGLAAPTASPTRR